MRPTNADASRTLSTRTNLGVGAKPRAERTQFSSDDREYPRDFAKRAIDCPLADPTDFVSSPRECHPLTRGASPARRSGYSATRARPSECAKRATVRDPSAERRQRMDSVGWHSRNAYGSVSSTLNATDAPGGSITMLGSSR